MAINLFPDDINPNAGPGGVAAQIAKALFEQSTPLRTDVLQKLGSAVPMAFQPVTMENITSSPLFGGLKSSVENQFDNARNRILGQLPEGGALFGSLAANEGARGHALAAGMGALGENELNRRMQLLNMGSNAAFGMPATALGGLGSAAASYANLLGLQQAQDQATNNLIGDALGFLFDLL